jgi:hypothetical protein
MHAVRLSLLRGSAWRPARATRHDADDDRDDDDDVERVLQLVAGACVDETGREIAHMPTPALEMLAVRVVMCDRVSVHVRAVTR